LIAETALAITFNNSADIFSVGQAFGQKRLQKPRQVREAEGWDTSDEIRV
jgi:hypothetical protein